MTLFILEGPRNSGKSTVVDMFKKQYDPDRVYLIKFQRTTNPPPPVFMTDFLAKNYLAIIDSRSICVLDRFHLTEFVMRSLDKKVSAGVLLTTTKMIDHMLKYCGAITYILKSPQQIRHQRGLKRDPDHRKAEWRDLDELDATWSIAQKLFFKCRTKVMISETPEHLQLIVKDMVAEQEAMTTLNSKIPIVSPVIEVEEEYAV